jgi:hypothetical protein
MLKVKVIDLHRSSSMGINGKNLKNESIFSHLSTISLKTLKKKKATV